MSTLAAECIADLDAALAENGQDIVLRRPVPNGTAIEKPIRAMVRGNRPVEIPGGRQQSETQLVLSPTGLSAEFADADTTRLRKNDEAIFDGRRRNVEAVEVLRVAGVLVRLNLTVRG